MNRQSPKKVRREIFVLTPEEKRTICFVLIAFLLGLATKHYRTTHSPAASAEEVALSTSASPTITQKRVKKDRSQPQR